MLSISRRPGQSIRVGDVLITVVRVQRGVVRIGIEAPDDVKILRTELEDRDEEADSDGE